MATAILNIGTRKSPFTISIKKVGDSSERFISLEGNEVNFTSDIGNNNYVSEVTDGDGLKSTAEFPLSCADDIPDLRPNCTEGPIHHMPTPIVVTGNTRARAGFHAAGVNPIRWKISASSTGATILHEGVSNTEGPFFTANFPALQPGVYYMAIEGVECKSPLSSWRSFEISSDVPSTPSQRHIMMNTTGYGFDPNNVNGINQEWQTRLLAFNNLSWNGNSFSGITGVRLCVKWYEFEPSEGVFAEEGLMRAINWLDSLNLKIAIVFYAVRRKNDGYVSSSEILIGSEGTPAHDWISEYTISPNSTIGKNKLATCCSKLAQVMKSIGTDVYIALGYGNTEEFFMPVIKNGPQTQILYNTGYGSVDQSAWNSWLSSNGHANIPMQVPPNFADVYEAGNFWNTTNGRKWYDFITDALTSLYSTFRVAVQSQGVKVCGYYAGTGGAQNSWYMMYRTDKILAGCDYIYSTDGGNRYDRPKKLMSIDYIRGTFPNAAPIIEWDPEDVGIDGQFMNNPLGMPLDWGTFYNYTRSGFKRGLKISTFAMSFSDGSEDNSMGNNIATSAESLWKLKTEFLDVENVELMPVSSTIYQQITSYQGDQPFIWEWSSRGGGMNTVVLIDTKPISNSVARFEPWSLNGSSIGGKTGDVWLPKNYSTALRYPVLYVMDGQTLYAKDGHSEGDWNLDVRVQTLIDSAEIENVIIVSVRSGDQRMREYLPNKPFYEMSSGGQATISASNGGGPLGDLLVNFIVSELKPFIDNKYSTKTDRLNTVIMGSSMGALFAAYAYGERPDIFGKGVFMATHYHGTLINRDTSPFRPEAVEYISEDFPTAFTGTKIVFNLGTTDLDGEYATSQAAVDAALPGKGFNSSNKVTTYYTGQAHTPAEWGSRIPDALKFVIPRQVS